MVRKIFTLPPRQVDKIKKEAEEKEISHSEVLRQILDFYFGRKK